jgi:hypothetical protein
MLVAVAEAEAWAPAFAGAGKLSREIGAVLAVAGLPTVSA